MAIYLLPPDNNRLIKRASKTLANVDFSKADGFVRIDPHVASAPAKTASFVKQKLLQMKHIKRALRWN